MILRDKLAHAHIHWFQPLYAKILVLFSKAVRTRHGFIVLVGLLIGLIYLPAWSGYLIPRLLAGKVGSCLILALLYLAIAPLWSHRHQLAQRSVSEADAFLGHTLIVSGIFIFPFVRFALWPQAIVWLMVLLGIAISSWGVDILWKFKLSLFFIGLTAYPKVGVISRIAWEFIFPTSFLETVMASISVTLMQAMGWTVIAQEQFIVMPEGGVEVGWGCNGLDMAITVAIAVLFIGILFKLSKNQIFGLIAVSSALSFVANIPRLILVTIAYVHWGKDWFNFWHGFWGGQIFSGILLTICYYLVVWVVNRRSPHSNASKF